MATADELKTQLEAHRAEEVRLIYEHRIAQAREHLATLDPGSEEYVRTAKHVADLEATGYHLPKE